MESFRNYNCNTKHNRKLNTVKRENQREINSESVEFTTLDCIWVKDDAKPQEISFKQFDSAN